VVRAEAVSLVVVGGDELGWSGVLEGRELRGWLEVTGKHFTEGTRKSVGSVLKGWCVTFSSRTYIESSQYEGRRAFKVVFHVIVLLSIYVSAS